MGYMFRLAALALATAVTSTSSIASAQQTYATDQGHTEVIFAWKHAGIAMQHGEFTKVEGALLLNEEKLEDSNLNVTIDMSSTHSGFERLDDVLMSDRFLDVETFPEATFQSTSIEVTGDKTAKVTGDLTLHGVTKPVVLDATLTHKGAHPNAQYFDHYKGDWLAFQASTEIDHQAFGIGSFSAGPISIDIYTELKAP